MKKKILCKGEHIKNIISKYIFFKKVKLTLYKIKKLFKN